MLVALNILITYIILVSVRMVVKIPTNKYCVALASFLGGFSSLVIFFDDMGTFFSVLYKLVTAALIVGIAFLPKGIRLFFKLLGSFFGINFLFGGAMYAVENWFRPTNIIYFNGTVYFDMSLSYLVGSVLSIYGVFVIVNHILEKRALKDELCSVKVSFRQRSVVVRGLIDSGNTLTEAATGRFVNIFELDAVMPLFEYDEIKFWMQGSYENVPQGLHKRIRLIPCQGVGGSSMLLGFVPDKVSVQTDKGVFDGSFSVVAVTSQKLSSGEYSAVINSRILNLKEEMAYENIT